MSLDILTLVLLVAQPTLITGCGWPCSIYNDPCYQYNMLCDSGTGFCVCKPGYTYHRYEPCCTLNPVAPSNPGDLTQMKCPSLEVANGVVTYSPDPPVEGASATLTCNSGYTSAGVLTMPCLAGGTWLIHLGPCKAICSQLNIANGDVSYSLDPIIEGVTATATCHSGYLLVGSATAQCLAAGTWSGQLGKCIASTVQPTNGGVVEPTKGAGGGGNSGHGQACISFDIIEWRQRMLKRTNELRKLHGAQPLTEDPQLTNQVQAFVEEFAGVGGPSSFHCEPEVAMFYNDRPELFNSFPERAVDHWYSFNNSWDFEHNRPVHSVDTIILPFTSLVWKPSRKVGYGIVFSGNCTKVDFAVCYYPEIKPGDKVDHNVGALVTGGTAAPPKAENTAAPPPAEKTAATPPPVQTTVPPPPAKTTAPPPTVKTAAPPPPVQTTAPPPTVITAAPPPQMQTTVPPTPVKTAAPPSTVGTTAPPPATETAAPAPPAVTPSPPPAVQTTVPPPPAKTAATPPTAETAVPPPPVVTASPPPAVQTTVPPPPVETAPPTPPAMGTTAPPSVTETAAPPPAVRTTAPPPTAETAASPPPAVTASPSPVVETTVPPRPVETAPPPPAVVTTAPPSVTETAAPPPAAETTAPSPAAETAASSPAAETAAPSPEVETAAPSPAAETAAPSPGAETGAPSPAAETAAPSPAAETAAPSPAAETAAPPPEADTTTHRPDVPDLGPP